ncbi:hypothetical protein JW933_09245 [candidate division FCPU426 bacterium]|nr:hypothetical protein [candidate division FCPU426 bacterium]
MRGRVRSQNAFQISTDRPLERKADEVARDFYRFDSRQRRVLVIGSEKRRPISSVGWLDEWPALADYDVVIINLQTLDRVTLVKLSRVDKERLTQMRAQLFDLMMSKGEIYCILAPFLVFGAYVYFPDGAMEPEWSNLNWSPIGFSMTEIRGETVKVEGEVKFEEYLRHVAGWDCYLNSTASLGYIEERLRREDKFKPGEELFWQSYPLAMNRYGKPLAASLCFGIRQEENKYGEPRIKFISDFLHLLPPPTKISTEEGIDLLIEEAKGLPARTITPDWVELYHVPGEEQIGEKIEGTVKRIRAAEREQKKLFQTYRQLQYTKSLLYEHGDNLKRAITEVLQRMGLMVKPYLPAAGLLVLHTRFGRMILDALGRSGPAQLEDLQILLRHAAFAQEDGRIWKGILVFNHYRLEDPTCERPAAFPAEVVARAREMRLGLMTAEGVYACFCKISKGSMLCEEFEERLHQGIGIIHLPVVETRHTQAMLRFSPPRLEME